MHATAQRTLIWCGIALLLIYFGAVAFLMGFIPPTSPSLSATQVVQMYTLNNFPFRLGIVITLLTGGGYLPLFLAVSVQMARHEKGIPICAILQALAAALGTIFIWGPPIFWGVAAYSVERDPALTLLMHQLGWLTFVTPLCLFPIQTIPIIVVSFSKEDDENTAFPRWMGYLTLLLTITGEVGVAPMLFNSGPFAWNGLPFYLPFGMFAIWVPALVFTMLRAISRQEKLANS